MSENFISLGKCSRLYLYILGSVIFKFIESISLGYTNEQGKNKFSLYGFTPILNNFNYMKSIFTYVGYILFGTIFYLIFSKKQMKNAKKQKKNLLPKGIIHNKTAKKSKKTFLQIFLFCFLFVFHIEIKKILYILDFQFFNIWTFDIFFMIFFLNKYFVVYFYKHQKYSIFFIILTSAVLLVISSILPFTKENGEYINSYQVAKKKGSYFYSFPLVLFFIFLSFIYSFSRVIGKVLMQIKFISPYILIIFLGITGLIFTLICASISKNTNYEDSINGYLKNMKNKSEKSKYEFYFEIFVVSPIFSFIMFMEIIFELLTVYYLNPLFILITNNLCYGVIQLITFIVEYKKEYGLPVISHFLCEEFAEVFALLGYSIYLEIIELRFCDLDENIKRKISIRGESEIKKFETLLDIDDEEKEEEQNEGSDEEEGNEKSNKEVKKELYPL